MEDSPEQTTVTEPSRDDLMAQMRSEAEAEDRNDSFNSPEEDSSTQTESDATAEASPDRATDKATDKATKTDSPEPSADGKTPERGPDGKFLKKADPTAAVPPQEQKPAPTKTKEEKDGDRLAKSWQQLEAEKAEIRALKNELTGLKQNLSTQRPNGDGKKFNSQDYERASYEFRQRGKKLMQDGDIDAANQQFELEEQTRNAAFETAKQEYQQSQEQFGQQWNNVTREVIREVPELGDPNTDMAKEMTKLLTDFPVLGYIPDGFRHGHEILKLRKEAAEASGLRDEVAKLKAEIERRDKLSAPTVAKDAAKHSSSSGGDKSLTWEQARKEAEAYDAAA